MSPREIDRRQVLAAAGALVGLGLPTLGCSVGAEPAPALRPGQAAVPLADLPEGERRIVVLEENPVEVLRSGDVVRARMLRCTHMGCVVRWKQDDRVYACPCHDGRYDADGNVLLGPPPRPLPEVPVFVRGGQAIVG